MLFTGIASQAIKGTAFTRFENISINNNSGVLLQQDAVINTLNLLRGPFILNKRALTVINSNPKAIIRNSGYLVREQVDNTGRVIWNMGNTTGTHVAPYWATIFRLPLI